MLKRVDPDISKHLFWAKLTPDKTLSMPLWVHSIDVAMVFRTLTDLPGFHRSLESLADKQLTTLIKDRLAALVGIHDIGKANCGFQLKPWTGEKIGHIRELAPIIDPESSDPALAERFLMLLPEQMISWFSSDEQAYTYFISVFSHHGRPIRFQGEKTGVYGKARDYWQKIDDIDPFRGIEEVITAVQYTFPSAFVDHNEEEGILPTSAFFQHRYAGLITLADWIGSNPEWFPIESLAYDENSLKKRIQANQNTIQEVLQSIGLDVDHSRRFIVSTYQKKLSFEEIYPDFAPRPLQNALSHIDLDKNEASAHLLIAEADTGSGKTEAAIYWFLKLWALGKVDSLYFALPTRVAATEIYRRVRSVVDRLFRGTNQTSVENVLQTPTVVLAVPGYHMNDENEFKILPDEERANIFYDDRAELIKAKTWAAEMPKKYLAGTIAVGTIDQALLSVIQTSHAHMRSILLDRSLLVVDEVHASDSYMTYLLGHLLEHHVKRAQGYAMLMSATLGSTARHRFLSKVSGDELTKDDFGAMVHLPYPSYTLLDGETRSTEGSISYEKKVRVRLEPWALDLEKAVQEALQAARDGARVLIVLNTVSRAVDMFRMIEERYQAEQFLFSIKHTSMSDHIPTLHHGRFAPDTRKILDLEVTRQMGKGTTSHSMILIGTQTLEQSLDIDADFLITDLAPGDVLLQRIGRLHRHARSDRPERFKNPSCLVLTPGDSLEHTLDQKGEAKAQFKRMGYGSVYEDVRTLELTVLFLKNHPEISIPGDNRLIVESVTHEDQLASLRSPLWDKHRDLIEGGDLAKAIIGGEAVIDFGKYFGDFIFNELGGRVATRLGLSNLDLPVREAFRGPFGEWVTRIVIPHHMAPKEVFLTEGRKIEEVTLEPVESGTEGTILKVGSTTYRYSRYGLERLGGE